MLFLVLAAHAAELPALQPRPEDALSAWTEWVEYQAAVNGVPGVSLGAVHGQDTLLATGVGLANREDEVPATSATRYGICSISKLFTSISLLQLADAGKLRLDDPVSEHLSWFTVGDPAEPITIREILTHTTGAPRETGLSYWGEPGFPFPTEKELKKQIPTIQALYPPDRYHQYSNLMMSIAGQVVAAAGGSSYESYVESHVLAPLGMSHTTTSLPVKQKGADLAVGYSARDRHATREPLEPYDARAMRSSFGFASNVDDLLVFLKWQLRLRAEGGEDVLRASTLREMQRVQWVDPDWSTTWGLGFRVARHGEKGSMIGHEGWCPGYRTAVQMDPDAEIGVVVLANATDFDPVLAAQEGLELLAPTLGAPTTPRDPDLDRYVGVYALPPHGEAAVVRWGDGLGLLWLDTRDPSADVLAFVKTGDNTFQRRRDDGTPGEPLVFRVADGKVTALVHEDNVVRRSEP